MTNLDSRHLWENNRQFHHLLTTGVDVTYHNQKIHQKLWLVDQSHLLNNDWLVMHPFTVAKDGDTQSADVVVFLNGLPLAVIVWMNPQDKQSTLKTAYQKIQGYLAKIPQLFIYNAFLIIACRHQALVGTITSDWQDFFPWRTIDGEDFFYAGETQLDVLIQGIFDKRRFLELVKYFIEFEEKSNRISKNLLRYPFCTIQHPQSYARMKQNYSFLP